MFSIGQGLRRGGTAGNLQAGLGAGSLATRAGAFGGSTGAANGALGAAGGALGIYNGIQQGGVAGYGGATVGALRAGSGVAQLAGNADLAGTLGSAAGYVAAPLAVYNAVENWQSGKTGSDALQGAEAGAAVGSIIPGVGTIVGGLVGGVIGAASSAFGPGASDPESAYLGEYLSAYQKGGPSAVASMTPQQTFGTLTGLFDARSSDQPIYQQFGRMGESGFLNSMAQQINSAYKSGTISANATPDQIYQKVVNPWIGNMTNSYGVGGRGWDVSGTKGNTGGMYNPAIQNLITQMIGQYTSGQLNKSTALTGSGSMDTSLPTYLGLGG